MKANLLITICFFLISCDNSEGEFTPEIVKPEIENNKVIVLDPEFTGLEDLPPDEGGEHKAYPRNSESNTGLGFYAYTPSGYYDNELEYPLILFLHGAGQRGNNLVFPYNQLERVLDHGPPKLIETGKWKPTYPCIVVSPQSEGDWRPDMVQRFIESLIDTYRVNTKRIYITGLSMGGRGCWFYEGEMGDNSYAAALVPICGRGPLSSFENLGNTPIWAFHGEEDKVVRPSANGGSFLMFSIINANNPVFDVKLTMYPEVGHNSWERTYDSSGMGTESLEYDLFDMTIYDWMFQFRKE